MLSSSLSPFWRLALVLLVSLSVVSNPVFAFHNETLNAAQFTNNFKTVSSFTCADGIAYSIQSTTTLGAVVSADFQGTAIYLLSLVDSIDRGQYDVTVDGGTPTSVAGDGVVRDCAVIYSKTGLSYGPHTISLTNARANPRNNTFTKFEFLAFFATVPDDSDLTTTIPNTATTPPASNTGTAGNSNNNAGTANSNALSAGAIAGIAIGAVAAICIVVVALVIYFHRQKNAHRYSNAPSYNGNGGQGDITPFPMTSTTPVPFQTYPSGNAVTMAPANKPNSTGSAYGAASIHDMQSVHSYGAGGAWAGSSQPQPPRGQLSDDDVDRIARRMAEVANQQQGRAPPPGPVFQQMSNPHLRQMLEDQRSTATGAAISPPPEPPQTTTYPREKAPRTPAPNYNAPYQPGLA